MNYAIRLSLPYADISGIFELWSNRSTKGVIYEHEADDEVKRTHCHIGLIGTDCKAEALKRMFKGRTGKGNEFWSFKEWDGSDTYITYMSKGYLDAKKAKQFSKEELDESRSKWVSMTPDPKKENSKEFYSICEAVLEKARKTPGCYTCKLVPSDMSYGASLEAREVIADPGKVYDILLKELKTHRIMTEMNQLTRFMVTIMREDLNQGEEIKNSVFRRIFSK